MKRLIVILLIIIVFIVPISVMAFDYTIDEETGIKLYELPNGVKDEIIDGKLIKKVEEYALQASDISQVATSPSQVNYVWIKKPSDFMYYGSSNMNGNQAFNLEGYENYVSGGLDNLENIGRISSYGNLRYFCLIMSKEMTTIEQARAELVGKALIYQLATPVEINIEPIQEGGKQMDFVTDITTTFLQVITAIFEGIGTGLVDLFQTVMLTEEGGLNAMGIWIVIFMGLSFAVTITMRLIKKVL